MFLNVLGVDNGLRSVPEAEGCLPVAHGRVAHEPAAGLVVVAETADGDGGEALGPAIVYEFVERGGRCGEPGGSGGGGGGSFAGESGGLSRLRGGVFVSEGRQIFFCLFCSFFFLLICAKRCANWCAKMNVNDFRNALKPSRKQGCFGVLICVLLCVLKRRFRKIVKVS